MSRVVIVIAAAVIVVLTVFASGYGYHRDELYFMAAGDHLAWGYADQGPLTPLIARAMTEISPESLTILRLPAAIAAGLIVLLTGMLAREFGGRPRAQAIAAGCAAAAAIVLFTGHLLSTSIFDLLVWTAVTWLAVRALRTGDERLWLVAGVVLGIGLLNKPLPAFLALGLLAGVAIAGPRALLRNPYVWGAAAIALALWAPWLIWQADHGWPQVDVSESIAEGGSTSSEPWWAIVPFQVLLFAPPLAPVWIAGLARLFRDPAVRRFRFLAVTWVVLALVFMASGGKPYYLAGLGPALIAAGSGSVDAWLDRGRAGVRRALAGGVLAFSAAVSLAISLPILPAQHAEPVIAMNEDVGETIGWPEFAETIEAAAGEIRDSSDAIVLTGNYGEAGAVERFGPDLGLPPVYSGHNAYGDWGPPPAGSAPVIAVGVDLRELVGCRETTRVDNGHDIDNDEQGEPVYVCDGPRGEWSEIWPDLRSLG